MEGKIILSVFFCSLILGMVGLSQSAFAEPFTVSPTFVDSFLVFAQIDSGAAHAFSTDGTKMFVLESNGEIIFEYTLGTPFDISTASYSGDFFSLASEGNEIGGMAFSPDGTKMFVVEGIERKVLQYTLGTPFDISTASYSGDFFPVPQVQNNCLTNVTFKPDGTKMFVMGNCPDAVLEYNLGIAFNVTTASYSGNSFPVSELVSTGVVFSPDGTKMFVIGHSGNVSEYILSNGFDLSNVSFVNSFLASQDFNPNGVTLSSDGTKVFVSGPNNKVSEYSLNGAYTLSPTFVDSFSVVTEEFNPRDVAFSSDGTKMFVVGDTGNDINEYTLGTPFDVSTASYSGNSFPVSQDFIPQGVAFSSNGVKMFVVGSFNNEVYEYTLGTPFDVSAVSFIHSFSVQTQDTDPLGVAFSSNGVKMFVVGDSTDTVYEYTLGTPFDVSTASYSEKSFPVGPQDLTPEGVAFSTDGTKMFVVGSFGDAVYEYQISPPILCAPPTLGDWTVNTSCTMTSNATAPSDVIIPNGIVLTIPNGVTLDINFATSNLTVQSGGKVLIQSGGAIT